MSKVNIIIAEGNQDASFIFKLLIENGFEEYKSEFQKLPISITAILQKQINEQYPDKLDTNYERMLFLPYIVTENKNGVTNYCLLYSMGGINKTDVLNQYG